MLCSALVKTNVLSEMHVETRTGLLEDRKGGEGEQRLRD